jgi:hypothetical protein
MRGKMSESLAGEAEWQDVGRGTFIRFTQFATRKIIRSHRPSSKRAISVFRKTQSRTRLCHLESILSQYQKPTTFGVSLQRSITRRKEHRQQLLSKPSTFSTTLSLNIDPTLQRPASQLQKLARARTFARYLLLMLHSMS